MAGAGARDFFFSRSPRGFSPTSTRVRHRLPPATRANKSPSYCGERATPPNPRKGPSRKSIFEATLDTINVVENGVFWYAASILILGEIGGFMFLFVGQDCSILSKMLYKIPQY